MEQREMTLEEWCAKLPKHHKVNKELRELLETARWADALMAGGVDNWEHYEDAMDMMES